jgi:hypothetical protein
MYLYVVKNFLADFLKGLNKYQGKFSGPYTTIFQAGRAPIPRS